MKQVLQSVRSGKTQLKQVPTPACGHDEVLVATRASLISAGTEKMLIDFSQKSLAGKAKERPDLAKKVLQKMQRDGLKATLQSVFAQLGQPLPLGYSCAGVVMQVGAKVANEFQVGDVVACAGAGLANHAEVNAVPRNLVVKVNTETPNFQNLAFTTVGAIALHGVRQAELTLGDNVLILGCGLVGQLAAQLANIHGANVTVMDYNDSRLSLCKAHANAATHNLGAKGADTFVAQQTRGRGYDAVIICAATDKNDPLENAIAWARDRATIVMLGKAGSDIPYADFMKKELVFRTSRSYGAGRYDTAYEGRGETYPLGYVPHTERDNLHTVAHLIASEKIVVAPLVTHTFAIEAAEAAYDLILGGKEPSLGVVLTYPHDAKPEKSVILRKSHETLHDLSISFVGAGNYTRSVLLPALKKLGGWHGQTVCSKGGVSAAEVAKQYDFAAASSDAQAVLTDHNSDIVFITTQHNTHAAFTQTALGAGKSVFLEKPLAMSLQEIADVEKVLEKSTGKLIVGYNRRFAPATRFLQQYLPQNAPKNIVIRANVGELPKDNWQNDTNIGGGRLLGEMPHFLDLAVALASQAPTQLFAQQGAGQDNYSVHLTFRDGSQATVVYTSEGDTGVDKEYVEVFTGGAVGIIRNFQRAEVTHGRTKRWKGKQDKGQAEMLRQFLTACCGHTLAPIPADELLISSKLALLAQQSIGEGAPVKT